MDENIKEEIAKKEKELQELEEKETKTEVSEEDKEDEELEETEETEEEKKTTIGDVLINHDERLKNLEAFAFKLQ